MASGWGLKVAEKERAKEKDENEEETLEQGWRVLKQPAEKVVRLRRGQERRRRSSRT